MDRRALSAPNGASVSGMAKLVLASARESNTRSTKRGRLVEWELPKCR